MQISANRNALDRGTAIPDAAEGVTAEPNRREGEPPMSNMLTVPPSLSAIVAAIRDRLACDDVVIDDHVLDGAAKTVLENGAGRWNGWVNLMAHEIAVGHRCRNANNLAPSTPPHDVFVGTPPPEFESVWVIDGGVMLAERHWERRVGEHVLLIAQQTFDHRTPAVHDGEIEIIITDATVTGPETALAIAADLTTAANLLRGEL